MSPHEQVPTFEERQSMWATLELAPVTTDFPGITQYLAEIRPLYANGRVEHAAFDLPDHPVLEWFLSRNQYHEVGFFEKFWKCRGPNNQFPQKLHDLNFFDQRVFSFSSPFLLGGGLAWMLFSGGAYRGFDRPGTEAKRLGEAAAIEMLRGSYDSAATFESGIAWSEFFYDVAWDHTFLVVDRQNRIIHTLLATDTD